MASLLLTGAGLGLLLAAQVGPVTLLIVRSVLRGGRAVLVGFAMAAAVASVDLLYATLGLTGAGELSTVDGVRLALGLTSGALLTVLGARTMWVGFRARTGLETADDVVSVRRAFGTALAATALNPLTIALWTISFPAAAPSSGASSIEHGAALLLGVAIGTLTWYGGFATAVAVARRRLRSKLFAMVDMAAGAGLVAFGGLLVYRTLDER